jgi:nucleoside-diphosphate-sugar epimerase
VSVDELVATVAEAAGKTVHNKYTDGPVGVQSCNFNARIYSLGWEAKAFLKESIGYTYPWMDALREAYGE